MIGAAWFVLVAAVLLAGGILWLVRRNRLHPGAAAWWLFLDILIAPVLVFQGFFARLSAALGIPHPVLLGIVVLAGLALLKTLYLDLARTKTERQLVTLAQRIALLEEKLRR